MAKQSGSPIGVDDSAQRAYEGAFNAKIDSFKDHPKYPQLRKNADTALNLHIGIGLTAIAAIDFMNRIIVQPEAEISEWLDGKGELPWSKEQIDYGTDKLAIEAAFRFAEAHHDKNSEIGGNNTMDENNTPQVNSSASQPLSENEYVQELFSILQENGKDTKGLSALIGHAEGMESYIKRAEDKISDMKSQLAEMKEVQNHPVKTALTNAIKSLETKVAAMKEQLAELKTNIVEGCKSAVNAFKENGAAALNNIAKFFHIKSGLKAIDKSAEQSVKLCDKAIAEINGFAENYHTAGRAVKNMGLIIIGREPVDAKKENGRLAKAFAAPYKAEKAIQNGIKKAVGKAITALDGMEERQAAKKQERVKKPSVIEGLAENKILAAEHNREITQRERTVVKGAEI